MKCPKTPLRTVVKMGANPHGSKAPDASDGLKMVIDGVPRDRKHGSTGKFIS
jgi:hypothetical protein